MDDELKNLSHDQMLCRIQYVYDFLQVAHANVSEDSVEEDEDDVMMRRSRRNQLEDIMDVFSEAFDGILYYGA